MPRRNRPKGAKRQPEDEPRDPRPRGMAPAPPGWHAAGSSGEKTYRCPDCNQEIRPGTRHIAAWQEGRDTERRHWHTPCWQRFMRARR